MSFRFNMHVRIPPHGHSDSRQRSQDYTRADGTGRSGLCMPTASRQFQFQCIYSQPKRLSACPQRRGFVAFALGFDWAYDLLAVGAPGRGCNQK
jgi:hypothetical protein